MRGGEFLLEAGDVDDIEISHLHPFDDAAILVDMLYRSADDFARIFSGWQRRGQEQKGEEGKPASCGVGDQRGSSVVGRDCEGWRAHKLFTFSGDKSGLIWDYCQP